jgi:hypothetical protein
MRRNLNTLFETVIPSVHPIFIGHNESMTEHGLKGQYLLVQGQATGRSIAMGSGSVTKIDRELT